MLSRSKQYLTFQATHQHEKVKLQETIVQQAKLIDFLQSKTENMEKRRKVCLFMLFSFQISGVRFFSF